MKKNKNEITTKNETDGKTKKSTLSLRAKTVEENPIIVLSKDKKEKPFDETIEEERKNIFKLYKNTSKKSTIMMILVVVIFVAAFALYPQGDWGKIVCWILVGVTLIGLIIYFILTKNLYPNTSKKYFRLFWKETNDYLFNAPEFSDCKIDTVERYVLREVCEDRVYTDIIDNPNRNIVRGLYKGKGFSFGELAFYAKGEKKNSKKVIFLGRRLECENKLHFEGRYIVNIKGQKETDLPNNIEDLKVLHQQNRFVIYGPEKGKFEKDLTKDLIENLKSIECNECVLNVNVVISAGKTIAYISLDDSVAAIPFENAINKEAYETFRKFILRMFNILVGE